MFFRVSQLATLWYPALERLQSGFGHRSTSCHLYLRYDYDYLPTGRMFQKALNSAARGLVSYTNTRTPMLSYYIQDCSVSTKKFRLHEPSQASLRW